jgi:hypothetical protein
MKTRMKNDIADRRREMAAGKKDIPVRADVPLDAEALALKAEQAQVVADYNEVFGKPGMSDAKRLELALKVADRSIAELERKAAAGDVFPEAKGEKTIDPRLAEKRARQKELRQIVKDIHDAADPKLTANEKQIRRLQRTLDQMEARVDSAEKGVVPVKEPKAERPMSPEAQRIEARILTAKKKAVDLEVEAMLKAQNWKQRTVRYATQELWALQRVSQLGFDFGIYGLQGGIRAFSQPVKQAKAFVEALNAFRSAAKDIESKANIVSDPDYLAIRKGGLRLSGIEPGTVDEVIRSRLANKLPGYRNFSRMTETFINRMRMDAIKEMAETASDGVKPTPAQWKLLAHASNVLTGSGGFSNQKANSVLEALTAVFLAPRWVVSRFQTIAIPSVWKGDARVRKAVSMQMGRAVASAGSMYLLAASLGAEFDEDGRFKLGGFTIDPSAGIVSALNFLKKARIAIFTDVEEKRDQSKDALGNYVVSKLAPIPAAVASRFRQKTLSREPATYGNLAYDMFVPITARDIAKEAKDAGFPENLALGVLSMLGVRVSKQYQKPEKQKATPKRR